MVRRILPLCLVVCLAAAPAWAIELAGRVIRLQGSAIATGDTGFSRPLEPGSTILVGDRVATGADSRLRLLMTDGGQLTLGSSSTLTIDAWVDDPTAGRARIGIVEGVFEAVSGAIAALGPDRMEIATPVAVLGVRGTDVWGQTLEDRLAVAMLAGTAVTVTVADRAVELNTPGSGVDVVAGEPLPDPKQWGADRLAEARAAVAFDGE